jgi:SAM-dependent methyltransferase
MIFSVGVLGGSVGSSPQSYAHSRSPGRLARPPAIIVVRSKLRRSAHHGDAGHVIGVDMTDEMLKKARDNATKIGAVNVEFRLGDIENLPITDKAADVVISNCVINLVPYKEQVFREACCVLRLRGRLAVSDIVNTSPLPAELQSDPALLCGCIAGAIPAERIDSWLECIGFSVVRVTPKPESRALIETWTPGLNIEHKPSRPGSNPADCDRRGPNLIGGHAGSPQISSGPAVAAAL